MIRDTYGFRHLMTLDNLMKAGLLKVKVSGHKIPNGCSVQYTYLQKMRLILYLLFRAIYIKPIQSVDPQLSQDDRFDYGTVKDHFGLVSEGDEDGDDMNALYAGYAPLSIRVIETLWARSHQDEVVLSKCIAIDLHILNSSS